MSEAIASKEERLAAYNANVAAAEKDPRLSPETVFLSFYLGMIPVLAKVRP